MAKGTVYEHERSVLRDPRSGLKIIRLTHGPCVSMNLYFEMCAFTEDDSHVVFLSQRYAGRDAPWDLFRVRTDGMELVQLTDCDDLSGIVVSPVTGQVLCQSAGEVHKMDILSMKEEAIAKAPGELSTDPHSLASIDLAGRSYFAGCREAEGIAALFKVDVSTGNVSILYQNKSERQAHIHVNPVGDTVYFGDYREGAATDYLVDADGGNLRPYPFDRFAHHAWLGETGKMQGTLLPPGHGLATFGEGDDAPEILTEGRYYWHSSASRDAKWIVADTNWPQEGIYLLHIPTGTVTYVCDPRSTPSHPQWTHPHPSLSPGMRYVLFNSDMTGVGQVYLVELMDEFLEQAATGYECKPEFM